MVKSSSSFLDSSNSSLVLSASVDSRVLDGRLKKTGAEKPITWLQTALIGTIKLTAFREKVYRHCIGTWSELMSRWRKGKAWCFQIDIRSLSLLYLSWCLFELKWYYLQTVIVSFFCLYFKSFLSLPNLVLLQNKRKQKRGHPCLTPLVGRNRQYNLRPLPHCQYQDTKNEIQLLIQGPKFNFPRVL